MGPAPARAYVVPVMDANADRAQADATADLLGLADVRRWGVIKTLRTQSVAEHTFNVQVLALELASRLGMRDSVYMCQLLTWALVHDVPETLSGDIDGKFKRKYQAVRESVAAAEDAAFPWAASIRKSVPESVLLIVKVADIIEAAVFIRTFGVGARADDVYRELLSILWTEAVPKLATYMGGDLSKTTPSTVGGVVNKVLNATVNESHSIQMRRFRDQGNGNSGGDGNDR